MLDTPISEAGFTGIGVGAAMTGMRPVVDIMFGDFLTLTMDQMVNQAAKVHYMSGGKWKVPMVLRTTLGATRRSAAQHSQSLHAWFSHIPGLKVVMPSTPYDAKGLLKIGDSRRQPGGLLRRQDDVQAEGPGARGGIHDSPRRGGREARRRATSRSSPPAAWCRWRWARRSCSKRSASARKWSIRARIWPLDEKTLIESAKKTSRAIVVDEGYGRYGVTAEIASVIAEGAFFNLDAPVKRMGAMHVPIPFSPPLEDVTVPTEQTVFEAARELCGKA